jgi:hypothetical protein
MAKSFDIGFRLLPVSGRALLEAPWGGAPYIAAFDDDFSRRGLIAARDKQLGIEKPVYRKTNFVILVKVLAGSHMRGG